MTTHTSTLRSDLRVIAQLIPQSSTVLDVGCGNGELLFALQQSKNIHARGMEIDSTKVAAAIARGLSVVQGDMDEDLHYYPDQAYEFVVSTETIQTSKTPHLVLEQLARIGKRVIVSVPNFGYWHNRLYLGLKGKMPMSETLSYPWYETPNIHFCTLADFTALCRARQLDIQAFHAIRADGRSWQPHSHSPLANLLGEKGVFILQRQ